MATETRKKNETTQARPEATQAAPEQKKRGRKPGSGNGPKQTGKELYPGCANGQKLSVVPTDWDSEKHKRLRLENFSSEALFTQWKEANKKERNFHPDLLDEKGEPTKKLTAFPADVAIEINYDYQRGGDKLVAFKPRHFSDRRALARAIVPALEAQVEKFKKISTMSDEQLQKLEKREELQKAIGRKVNVQGGQIADKDAMEALISMLPPEMQAKLLGETAK